MFTFQKMHDKSIISLARQLRSKRKTYQEKGGILGLTMFSDRKLCTYERRVSKKRGERFLLDKAKILAIKRKIESLKCSNQKVVSSRIVKDLNW